jgi:hypothetical protein
MRTWLGYSTQNRKSFAHAIDGSARGLETTWAIPEIVFELQPVTAIGRHRLLASGPARIRGEAFDAV